MADVPVEGPRVVSVSVTAAGAALAAQLPYEHQRGDPARRVAELWADVDGLVLFLAAGAAVRLVAPLLGTKDRDPAVVTVDEAGRWVVALLGGHAAGANRLAADVAAALGATPVVTTASDSVGRVGLDQLSGLTVHGPLASAGRALLDGAALRIEHRVPWPLDHTGLHGVVAGDSAAPATAPAAGPAGRAPAPVTVAIDDHRCPHCHPPAVRAAGPPTAAAASDGVPAAGTVLSLVAHPPSLVVGVGCSTDATVGDVAEAVTRALTAGSCAWASVATVATVDRRADHRAVAALGRPVQAFPADVLAGVAVPNPSAAVQSAVGTPSVAEAAALQAAGPDGSLVVVKTVTPRATAAVARRTRPVGRLALVGLGPGDPAHRTPAATAAVRHATAVVGYGPYVDQCQDLLHPGQTVLRSPIGAEVERARHALDLAAAGHQVALVCSGDSGVFAMASPVLEVADAAGLGWLDITVVPGVTAATAAAAVLGAPLGHDHALISLSDLLTPWEVIERRIAAAAAADLVVALYNPRSARRRWQLARARSVLLAYRPPSTPVGVVSDVGRPGQSVRHTTLADLHPDDVTMTTCVIVGANHTTVLAGRMVTPRGYASSPGHAASAGPPTTLPHTGRTG